MSTTAYGRAGYDFAGAVAVVTGGASGIGAEVAAQLRRSGARVAVWDMAQATANDDAWQVDVSDLATVEHAAAAVAARFGRIDFVVNSAGFAGPTVPLDAYDPATWRRIVDVNLVGTFNVCRAVVPHLRAAGAGRIVNIASLAGKEGTPNASAYSAAKAGVIALTKSLGKELATQDIAVNCITPAAARTRIFDQMTEEHIGYMLAKIPRGRFLLPEEVASMVAFLASAENSFTTGGVFDLSGGRATY